jgi:hypothetical protein
LWPCCRRAAGGDLEQARRTFALHVSQDAVWSGVTPEEIARMISCLK